ncbi:MAG: Rrf2 family transcriptional regulator [Actinomycetota bacterium]|nr:Rrf2 family transcriptional regulator [Actinomycetota bacterium]
MQLTRFTDLALRLVMRLAVIDPAEAGSRPTTHRVAEDVEVPYTHAAKAVARLRVLGVVDTRRGRGGGLSITEFGREVSIGWLARQLEGAQEVIECEGKHPCPLRHGCRLRAALARAREAFFAELDSLTLADLTTAPTGAVLVSLTARRAG